MTNREYLNTLLAEALQKHGENAFSTRMLRQTVRINAILGEEGTGARGPPKFTPPEGLYRKRVSETRRGVAGGRRSRGRRRKRKFRAQAWQSSPRPKRSIPLNREELVQAAALDQLDAQETLRNSPHE